MPRCGSPVKSSIDAPADEMGIDVAALATGRRMLARRCIDGTERRPHLGGALGAAMLERMLSMRWVAKVLGSRALRITSRGQEVLSRLLGDRVLPHLGT